MTGRAPALTFHRLVNQHAGPKLRGYASSTVVSVTVAQNPTPTLVRSSLIPAFYRRDVPCEKVPCLFQGGEVSAFSTGGGLSRQCRHSGALENRQPIIA